LTTSACKMYCDVVMKSRTHTLRGIQVDADGKELFAPLREHPTEPAVKRVETVLTLMVEADTLAREQREKIRLFERSGKDWRNSGPLRRDLLGSSNRAYALLNTALLRYRWVPLAQGGIGRFGITERAVTTSTGRWAPWECWAVGQLLRLARKGELSRLRRCTECCQWFYAIRGHQQFCRVSCRRRHTAQDPEFKVKRAAYMRDTYRLIEKEKEARSKRQAARVLSEKSKKGGK